MNDSVSPSDSELNIDDFLRVIRENPMRIEDFVRHLPASEIARSLSHLPNELQNSVIEALGPEDAARFVESVCETQAAAIVAKLPPEFAAEVIHNVESDEQADILNLLQEPASEAILSKMDHLEALQTRQRLEYPQHSAGGLMITEYLSYPQTYSVSDVVNDLREKSDDFADHAVQYVFVVSNIGELVGVLRLRDLVIAPLSTSVEEIMLDNPISVAVDAELPELEDFFDKFRFLAMPVVDSDEKIVGVVRRAAVEEAAGQRSDSDYLKSSGILGGEELRSMPLKSRSLRRLSWLSTNVLLNLCAASIIAFYQETLQAVIALAVFLPIISDMSGCSGSQAIAVSIRELTLGLIRPKDIFSVLRKEVLVGIFNGVVLGAILMLAGWLWQDNVWLGAVVGTALAINTIIAVSVGGMLPLVLKHFDKDPALASGPILTTLTDMCGFFIVLSLAQFVIPLLTS